MRHYANPDETTFVGSLFVFRFGAYGETEVAVYQRPGCLDDALETAAEWLKDNAPGHFVEPEYPEGLRTSGELTNAEFEACAECEEDLTYTESGWLASWEWTVDEIEDDLPAPHFDRFDIIQAHSTYWASWHGGQFTEGYRALCRAQGMLGCADVVGFDGLTDNGKAIYRQLCAR